MKRLRFLVSLPNDNRYQREQAKAAKETAERFGADVDVVYAENDAVKQSQQILEIMQSKEQPAPDAILAEPLTATGLVRIAEAAASANIAWGVLNSEVDYIEKLRLRSKSPIFSVTRDHTEIGRVQGKQFNALLPKGGAVLYIQGPVNSAAAAQRTTGVESVKLASIELKTLRSQWTEANAHSVVANWLKLSTATAERIGVVGCQYDGIAMGARRAFEEVLDSTQRDRWLKLPFTGVDGLPQEGQAWVTQGILTATVVSTTTTQVAIELLVNAMQIGKQPPACTLLEATSFPPLNVLEKMGKTLK